MKLIKDFRSNISTLPGGVTSYYTQPTDQVRSPVVSKKTRNLLTTYETINHGVCSFCLFYGLENIYNLVCVSGEGKIGKTVLEGSTGKGLWSNYPAEESATDFNASSGTIGIIIDKTDQ